MLTQNLTRMREAKFDFEVWKIAGPDKLSIERLLLIVLECDWIQGDKCSSQFLYVMYFSPYTHIV